ncbi:MAG: DUF4199 domain-containing protein [Chitinophagales bacterium]
MEDKILDINEKNQQLKIVPYYLKFGLIAVFISIIFSMIIYFIGLEFERKYQYVNSLAPIILVVLCLVNYKKDNGNRLKGNTGFTMGFLMFLLYGIAMGLFTILYVSVISPDFIAGIKEVTIEQMKTRGLDDEMIATQMRFASFFFSPAWFFIVSVLMNVIMGLIVSGITAAIMKTPQH